jgi:hypothetical protein
MTTRPHPQPPLQIRSRFKSTTPFLAPRSGTGCAASAVKLCYTRSGPIASPPVNRTARPTPYRGEERPMHLNVNKSHSGPIAFTPPLSRIARPTPLRGEERPVRLNVNRSHSGPIAFNPLGRIARLTPLRGEERPMRSNCVTFGPECIHRTTFEIVESAPMCRCTPKPSETPSLGVRNRVILCVCLVLLCSEASETPSFTVANPVILTVLLH